MTPTPIHAGTMAQDWRNVIDWENLVDFDYVAVSSRAKTLGGPEGGNGAAAELIARDVNVLFTVFPCFFWWQGAPLPEGDWERIVNDLAVEYDAILKKPDGTWATTDSLAGCFVLDFRNADFVREYARVVTEFMAMGQGILEHGACASMSWDPQLQFLSAADWTDWSEGFRSYFEQLRLLRPDWDIVSVCDRWGSWTNETYDGLFFEHVGSSLNPIGQKVYDELATAGVRNVVALYDTPSPQTRRGAAVMAILWDALFLWGRETTVGHGPEHFEIQYGDFDSLPAELTPGVWARVGSRGFVVGNFSDAPFMYTDSVAGRSFTIAAHDGLAAQFADADTGEMLADWITNEGR